MTWIDTRIPHYTWLWGLHPGPCHGIGLMECEHPWMETNSEYELQENYTFQVDSFLYTQSYGARWEDGVRVTKDGVEQFSTYRRELIVICAVFLTKGWGGYQASNCSERAGTTCLCSDTVVYESTVQK